MAITINIFDMSRKKIPVMAVDCNGALSFHKSQRECARTLNLDVAKVCEVVNGKKLHTKGYCIIRGYTCFTDIAIVKKYIEWSERLSKDSMSFAAFRGGFLAGMEFNNKKTKE